MALPGATGLRRDPADAVDYARGNVPYRNRLYPGTVTHVHPETGRVDVELTGFNNHEISNCALIMPVFGSMVGFRMKCVPPVGSAVMVLYVRDDLSYVTGATAGNPFPDNQAGQSDSETGIPGVREKVEAYEELRDEGDPYVGFGYEQEDMLEGEFDLSNVLGVGLTLLTSIAKLKAGDRAKLEMCCHNDMVRMVSRVFRHFSAFGLEEIYSEGNRLNAVWDGTSYDHEAWGLENADDPKSPELDERGVPLKDPEELRGVMRSRFSQYLGHLGDFIHGFVTDPMDALEDIGAATAARHRAGKMRYHVGNDGNLLIQSVADITIERTHRIPVPVKRREWHEEDGEGAPNPNLQYLRSWRYQSPQTRFHAAYQLREYARWLSCVHGYARFLESPQWEVPTEAESPEPARDADEADRTEINESDEIGYIEAYACWRMLRDGSIVSYGGDRTAIVQSHGSIQLSAPVNISMYAGQDINMVAGQDINIKARRHMELSAIVGGLKLKAQTWFHALSELGGMLLESNAVPSGEEDSDPGDADNPAPDVREHAVLIKAGHGSARVQANTEADILANTGDVRITSRLGGIDQIANTSIELRARTGSIWMKANQSVRVLARSFIAHLAQGSGLFSVNNKLNLVGGTLHAFASIRAQSLYSLNITTHNENLRGQGPHAGHVAAKDRDGFPEPEALTEASAGEYEEVIQYGNEVIEPPEPADDTFEYRDGEDYGSDVAAEDGEVTAPPLDMESITIQDLRLDAPDGYSPWGLQEEALMPRPHRDSTRRNPWPGAGRNMLKHTPTSAVTGLDEPNAVAYEDIENRAAPLTAEPTQYQYKKKESSS